MASHASIELPTLQPVNQLGDGIIDFIGGSLGKYNYSYSMITLMFEVSNCNFINPVAIL